MVKTAENPLRAKGFKGFLRHNIFIIAAFLLPALFMVISFALCEIAPFGKNVILVCDSWHQYYPFLRELQLLLKEGSLPFYSWNVGGGSNFLGVMGNYLASPLYLFTYFLPSGHIWLQMYLAFTVALRIGCAGGFMAIFLRKVFNRNDLSLVYFSIMYALCGYVMGYYWNMMWLDSIALMPLVIAGVVDVLKNGKMCLYTVSLALAVIFSFYIGYFICIFVLLFSICYTIVNFVSLKHSLKNAGKMLLYTGIAFMITAFMTIPVYMALSHSDSAADASGFPLNYTINYAYGTPTDGIIDTLKSIIRTVTNLLSFTKPITLDKGEPNIFCGALSLALGVFYVACRKIRLKEKIVALSLLGFMVLSFVVNQLNYIWHGFNTPAMVYYRFSFIFSFILVLMAYRAFCLVDSFGKKAFVFSAIVLALYLVAAFFVQRKLAVAITAAAAIFIMLVLFLYRKGKLKYRVFSLILCLFVMCEMGLSSLYALKVVGYNNGSEYPIQEKAVSEFIALQKEQSGDDMLYRTEFLNPFTYNDGAMYSVYALSTFNSMCRVDYSDMFGEIGLSASKSNNRYVYYETTPVTNMFLNIKYLIDKDDTEIVDTTYFNEIATADESVMYENKAYIPMGFMADKGFAEYKLHDTSQLPIITQNEMFGMATGLEGDVLEIIEPEKLSGNTEKLEPKEGYDYYYSYNNKGSTADEAVTVDYSISEDGNYYGMFKATGSDSVDFTVNGEERKTKDKFIYIMALGELKAGDKIKVNLPLEKDKEGYIISYVCKLDNELFKKGYDLLSSNTMNIKEVHNRGFKGEIDVEKEGLFYTSVLYDEGWKAYVDGEEAQIIPVGSTFSALMLKEGKHSIEFKFVPQGVYAGIAVTALGIALCVITCVLTQKVRAKASEIVEISEDAEPENSDTEEN